MTGSGRPTKPGGPATLPGANGLGYCPACKTGHVVRGKTAFGCVRFREGCTFRLPAEMHGKKLSDPQVKALLDAQTPVVCVVGKTSPLHVEHVFRVSLEENLAMIGDSSDTIALHAQATLLGWDVLQWDTTPFPADLIDDRTAVVIATHNFGRDCAALRNLMPADLRYLGLVGSRHRRDDILFDVLHHGITVHDALYAPAGLHLGADTPEEIALSIIAEIQSVFSGTTAQQLRHRKAPIHQITTPEFTQCHESAA